jgi:hypothetical protein
MEIKVIGQVRSVEPEELKKLIEKLLYNPDLIYTIKELYIVNEGSRWVAGHYIVIRHNELLGFDVEIEKDRDLALLKLKYSTVVVEVKCVRNECFMGVESLIACTCGEQV